MNQNVKGSISNILRKKNIIQRIKMTLVFNILLIILLSQYLFVYSSSINTYSINDLKQENRIERRIVNKFNLQHQKQIDYIINNEEKQIEELSQSLNINTERIIAKANQILDSQKLNTPLLSIFKPEPSTSLSYTSHSPISINSNDDFIAQANSEGWIGSGTEADPYIISGLNITSNTEQGISIYNTTLFFNIEDCIITGGTEGIHFHLVSNAKVINTFITNSSENSVGFYTSSKILIDNCSISGSNVGMNIQSSEEIEINSCKIFDTNDNGVQIAENSRYITGINNVFRNVLFGFQVMHRCYNITITGNQFYEMINADAVLSDWESSWNFTISGNLLFNKSRIAINEYSYNNIVSNNTFYGGTLFIRGDNNKVFNNLFISDGEVFGQITLNDGNFNEIKENIMEASISISNLTNTFIENNIISSLAVYQDGISIFGSSYITVKNNTIHHITKGNGISVSESFEIDMIDNSIGFIGTESDPREGINLYLSSNLSIINNEISNATRMGMASYKTNSTTIENNFFYNISLYGLHFPAPNYNIIIQNNTFENMLDRAIDIGGTNNIIQYNTIKHCKDCGITLPSFSFSKIINNTIKDIGGSAISSYWGCLNLEIANNFISNSSYGLGLSDSLDLIIQKNTITNILDVSIYISFTGDYQINYFNSETNQIIINNNELSYSRVGICMCGQNIYSNILNLFIFGNTISNHADNGIQLHEFSGLFNIYDNFIDNCGWAGIELWGDENGIVENNSIYYCDNSARDTRAIQLDFSYNVQITENHIESNNIGIYIYGSSNSSITLNSFISNANEGIIIDENKDNLTEIKVMHNNFINNNPGGKQASDFGSNNVFILNYWSDHTNTDANGDGIADEPYYLGGNTGNADNFPLVDLVSEQSPTHVMTIPSIIYPVSGITLSGVEKIKWKKAYDSMDYEVFYDLYYSKDNGNSWIMIANTIKENSYNWDTTSVSDGDNYKLKVIADDNHGLTSVAISKTFRISNAQNSDSTDTKQTVEVSSWSIFISLSSFVFVIYALRKRFFFRR
ncbi:MAG: right-handed parallel beta-helix repeat-containing protein [Candidatus Heimdallarchaeum endolithica]|uniref:Right-handed parallel beta-helix repeat-containing protein n=1 Tax=Candidatus Heimdallarchaeum endolithica TaxID=2876572 RepID=A0A9Y1BS18_9ARCH|nr:MAG: right-handed parallel beta-helix repeat-containing protein [Candidatus Heimdallarchaeum endolithica]